MKFAENKLVGGGGNSLKFSHNQGLRLFLECQDVKMLRSKVCYYKSSLRANAKQSSENCHPELDSGSINVDLNVAEMEPSPEFLSSSQLTKKFNPLTEKEGNSFNDMDFSRFTSHFSLKRAAFTLAEVLVTLGIIGVVSAMTVPTLMQNYQRKSYVTQLHKVYNELTQAFLQFKNDRNAIWLSEAGHVRHQDMMPFMKQYFKVVQDCGKTSTPCFANSYKNLNGSTFELTSKDENATYYGVLASGASFGIKSDGIDTGTNYTDDFLYRVAIDVNGQKGPNIYGRDLFILYIYSDGVVDAYRVNPGCRENNNCTLGANPSEHREKLYESCASSTGDTWYDGCFAKILNDNWEMNY